MDPMQVSEQLFDSAAPRLRILHVVSAYYPAVRYGGPIRSVHGLSAALARRGHDVHVYTTNVDGESELDVPLDRPVTLDGVVVHYFRVPAFRRLWWSPDLDETLRVSVGDFDLVHIHAVFLLPLRAAARHAMRAGVPYIMTPRGMLVRDLINRKNRWIKRLWIELVERKSLAYASGLHVTAELEADELQAMGLAVPATACIPNGVEFPAAPAPLSAGPFASLPPGYALFLSRISWKKGLDRLITAWQWVPDLPLVIVGNDDENYQPKLEQLARSLGLAERVKFLGPASDAHKWALYANAEVFILPSHSENFGNVVAEAMAMGCPVIISAQVGIASLVQAGGCGVVCDCEPRELAAVVRAQLSDPQRRRAMGARGKQLVLRKLGWNAVAAQAEQFYCRIIDKAGATSAHQVGKR
jgi:glycosyltransferase involved in cell wall biosynthesis